MKKRTNRKLGSEKGNPNKRWFEYFIHTSDTKFLNCLIFLEKLANILKLIENSFIRISHILNIT